MFINAKMKDLFDFYHSKEDKPVMSVLTPNGGTTPINDVVATRSVRKILVRFENGVERVVSETHRFRHNGKEVYAIDATHVDTMNGIVRVVSKDFVEIGDVYDIMIEYPNWYVDQHGMIHHNCGKSLGLCALTADYLAQGLNVLYISMEMSEEMVSKRIDANMMNLSMDDFDTMTGGCYKKRIREIADRNKIGKLVIKQYPTGGASVNHFNALMDELKTKKGWKPDVVMVDYLGICASSRLTAFSENSYALIGAISEELRGFAVRHNVAVWSGAQTNRNGWNSSDIEMADIAESSKLAATADFILALMENDELAQMGKQIAKQIKSRYGNKSINSKFEIGVDKGKQRWYELDSAEEATNTVPDAHKSMQQYANNEASKRAVAENAVPVEKSKRSMLDEFADTVTF